MNHLSRDQLSALRDGVLEGRARSDAERHLESCAECRAALAALAALDASLGRALEHDPGEAYFEGFADRVAARLAAERRGSARPAGGAAWWASLLRPRTLVWAGSAAAVIVVSAIVYMQSREARSVLERPELTARAQQKADAEQPREGQQASGAQPFAQEPGTRPAPEAYRDKGEPQGDKNAMREKDQGRAAPTDANDLRANERRAQSPAATGFAQVPNREEGAPAPAGGETRREKATVVPVPSAAKRALRPAAPQAAQTTPPPAAEEATRQRMDEVKLLERQLNAPLGKESAKAQPQTFAAPPGSASAPMGALGADQAAATIVWPEVARPIAAKADSVAHRAERATEYDSAAALWRRARSLVPTFSQADREARAGEADARCAAWELDPTPAHRLAARAAALRALELPLTGERVQRIRLCYERVK